MNRDQWEYLKVLGFDPTGFGQTALSTLLPEKAPEEPHERAQLGKILSSESAEARRGWVEEGDANTSFSELKLAALSCEKCSLAKTRKNVVWGEGDEKSELMFVGEGPGADEDEQGRPFVGKAGQLLTKMIQAMGYAREEVFIANIVKCRPPGNRNPEPSEIEQCHPYLNAQISQIKPKVIVALGKFSAQYLLSSETPISRMRGVFQEHPQFINKDGEAVRVMPTFHPAFLLRNPASKREVWADLQLVMSELKA